MAKIEIVDPQFSVPTVQLPSPGSPGADVLGVAQRETQELYGIVDKRLKEDGELDAAQATANHLLARTQKIEDDRVAGRITDGYTPQVLAETDEFVGQYLKDNTNPYLQRAFKQKMVEVRSHLGFRASANESAVRTARNYSKADDTIRTLQSAIANDPSPANYTARLADAQSVIKTFADQGEIGTVEKLKDRVDQFATTYANSLIVNEPQRAVQELFSKKGVAVDVPGPELPALQDRALNAVKDQETKANANASYQRSMFLNDSNHLAGELLEKSRTTGYVPTYAEMQQLQLGYDADAMLEFEHQRKLSNWVWYVIGDAKTTTNSELQKALEISKPNNANNEVPVNEQAAVYDQVQRIVNEELTLRGKDPHQAAANGFAPVREMWAEWETTRAPETLDKAISAGLAAQTAMGIATVNQSIMPNSVAEGTAAILNKTPLENAAKQLDDTARQFGPKWWLKAYKQMSQMKLLDPGMLVAPTINNPIVRTQTIEASRMKDADLRAAAGYPSEGETGVNKLIANNPVMQQMKSSLSRRSDGRDHAAALQKTAERLAMTFLPGNEQLAADKAVQQIVTENYTQVSGGVGVTFRMPRTAKAEPTYVELASSYMREHVVRQLGNKLDIPSDLLGVPRKWTANQYKGVLMNNAYWVTNDDESGVSLYVGGVPVKIGGQEIQYGFEALSTFGRNLPKKLPPGLEAKVGAPYVPIDPATIPTPLPMAAKQVAKDKVLANPPAASSGKPPPYERVPPPKPSPPPTLTVKPPPGKADLDRELVPGIDYTPPTFAPGIKSEEFSTEGGMNMNKGQR